MGKNLSPTGMAGTGTFPVYPSPLPAGEPTMLQYMCLCISYMKQAQLTYDGPSPVRLI
jgi:hypothetical protein